MEFQICLGDFFKAIFPCSPDIISKSVSHVVYCLTFSKMFGYQGKDGSRYNNLKAFPVAQYILNKLHSLCQTVLHIKPYCRSKVKYLGKPVICNLSLIVIAHDCLMS